MYTSLKLSKKLADNGCNLESNKCWVCVEQIQEYTGKFKPEPRIINISESRPYYKIDSNPEKEESKLYEEYYPAYDLLWDICVKYAKEFFGEGSKFLVAPLGIQNYQNNIHIIASNIIRLLQQDKIQEAEDYIWENCLFNPKNK